MNEWRQMEEAKVGLGFNVPVFVPEPIVRKVRRNRKKAEIAISSYSTGLEGRRETGTRRSPRPSSYHPHPFEQSTYLKRPS